MQSIIEKKKQHVAENVQRNNKIRGECDKIKDCSQGPDPAPNRIIISEGEVRPKAPCSQSGRDKDGTRDTGKEMMYWNQ